MLARVLAVRHGTIERYEAGARLPPLVALFYEALLRAIALVGPDETWGPVWLTRSQRLVWILQVAEGCSCLVDAPASAPARGARRRCEESVIAEPDARARMHARRLLAVSQKEMADLFGFEHWVVHRWEAGSSHPRGLACDLYAAIPAAVQRHGRVTAWGPSHLTRPQRVLRLLQLGQPDEPRSCRDPRVHELLSGPPSVPRRAPAPDPTGVGDRTPPP